jgi:tetratricopeptide (TPR) repeat protein
VKHRGWIAGAAFALAACGAAPAPAPSTIDPQVYHRAQGPVAEAQWQQARRALAIGDHRSALPALAKVIELCPECVRAHIAWQDTALAFGGEAEATMRAWYRDLREVGSPVPAYVKARLFDTSYARGVALAAILEQHRSFGWAHLSQARIRRGQGQLLVAVDSFRAAFANDPNLVEARLERAEVLDELGRREEAAVDYEAYFAAAADDWTALREYAAMLIYRLIRIDRALELLARLDAQFPGDLELRMHRGAALWRAGRPREALGHYLAVIEADPGNARALFDVGLIYYDALPRDDSTPERRRWWPKARAAFRLFLARSNPGDGQESFERSLGVPYRLAEITRLLGGDDGPVTLDDLRLPAQG